MNTRRGQRSSPTGRSSPTPDARSAIAALATPDRLRVFSAIVLGTRSLSAIAEQTGLELPRVATGLGRLQKAGLVIATATGFVAETGVFATLARQQAPARPAVDYGTSDPEVVAVLNAFLADGRIVAIPTPRGKRRILLEHIVVIFEPGHKYTEAEVNAFLASFHPDTAALRRYLVDEELLDRADGFYWRIGGYVNVGDDAVSDDAE